VQRVAGATNPLLPAELVPRQNALLDARLRNLRAEEVDRVRRELIVEIQAEREKANQRVMWQRKELRIDVEHPDDGERSPGP
jgi:signal recognition particle subunit SEC65